MSSIVFIGGGNMASCIIGGMISQGFESTDIMVSVPTQISRDRLKSEFKVQVTDDNRSAVASADVVILAVKPQIMRSVALDTVSYTHLRAHET